MTHVCHFDCAAKDLTFLASSRRKISCPELGNDNDDNLAYEPELPSDFLVLLMPHVG
jgi:hypothetical protein